MQSTIPRRTPSSSTEVKNIIRRGKETSEQINILGDDGVPMSYHVTFWKSELVDFVILQQDAFDAVDALCPMARQRYMLDMVLDICHRDLTFDDYEACRDWFKRLINDFRQMNYSPFQGEQFNRYRSEILKMVEDYGN